MKKSNLVFSLAFWAAIAVETYCSPALACDPNANCQRCIPTPPFGKKCFDDPACVAVRNNCSAVPPVVRPAIPGPGEGLPPVVVDPLKCMRDPVGCTKEQIEDAQYQGLKPIINAYFADLANQARTKTLWQFDDNFINQVQSYYPEIDLRSIRFVTGIATRHGQNMTIGNMIYIVQDNIDTNDPDDRHLLFHEFQHSVQYKRFNNNVDDFLKRYFVQSFQTILSRRRFNVHDSVPLEQEAIAKSIQVSHDVDGRDYQP